MPRGSVDAPLDFSRDTLHPSYPTDSCQHPTLAPKLLATSLQNRGNIFSYWQQTFEREGKKSGPLEREEGAREEGRQRSCSVRSHAVSAPDLEIREGWGGGGAGAFSEKFFFSPWASVWS